MFTPGFSNYFEVAQRLGFQMEWLDYEAAIQREKDEARRKKETKYPRPLLALTYTPHQPQPNVEAVLDGGYTVEFDESVR